LRRTAAVDKGLEVLSLSRVSNDLRLRPATLLDVPFLVDSNAAMAFATEHKTLDRAILRKGIESVFADARRGFYLIAERGATRVGCLLVTFEWSDWRNGDWWWIQSVYVTEQARRSGVFRALYADVERRARAAEGVVGLRLYVEQENATALATYAALGMEDAGYRLMQSGLIDFGAPPGRGRS
jgi:GNAT superfamily N-acetyltransferase